MSAQLETRSSASSRAAKNEPTTARRRQRYNGPLKAVIFDWAGTIVDFGSRAPVLAVMQVFNERNVPITMSEARGPMGMAKRDHINAIFQVPRVREAWKAQYDKFPDEQTVDEIYNVFLGSQREVLVDSSSVIPGAVDALKYCRSRNLKVGSSTGYTA